MRIAALYDIHGNLPALEAVLEDCAREEVEHIVVGGDVTLGPLPRATLERLAQVECSVVYLRGNCEVALLDAIDGRGNRYGLPDAVLESVHWTAQQMTSDQIEQVRQWPKTVHVSHPCVGDILFCHATPRDENEIFTRETHEELLEPIFDLDASLVVCGHTHMQFDRTVGLVRVVNAGSVGAPWGDPGAYWLLIDTDVRLQRTQYDTRHAASVFAQSSFPLAASTARNVVRPRPEAEMIAAFSKMELKGKER